MNIIKIFVALACIVSIAYAQKYLDDNNAHREHVRVIKLDLYTERGHETIRVLKVP
jgi:hypothetical protein